MNAGLILGDIAKKLIVTFLAVGEARCDDVEVGGDRYWCVVPSAACCSSCETTLEESLAPRF